MSAWDALMELDQLVDESDPDIELGQLDHALQTAEAARVAGEPEWLVLTALVHDLGKVLCLFDEPQWAVVGDTFPLGCAFSEEIIFSGFFSANPDSEEESFRTPLGVYESGCGLGAVTMSWGHDEYIYHVTKDYLPAEAQYMLRYHSFYPWHTCGEYKQFMNDEDKITLEIVKYFNQFDLYSKEDDIKISPEYVESDTGKCINLFSEHSGDGYKFKEGDILKSAGWNTPTLNQARGNIFEDYSVAWTGPHYISGYSAGGTRKCGNCGEPIKTLLDGS